MPDGTATSYERDPAALDAADPLAAFRDRFVSKFPMRFVALLNLFCFLSPGLFLALGGALP